MNKSKQSSLGTLLKDKRKDMGLSTHELGDRTGVTNSTIMRIEQGSIANPRPDLLKSIADVLELKLADVYTAAGYVQPEGFPSFAPYLRSRYAHLPEAAQAELEASFSQVAKKYGYDPDGPAEREDESN